MSKLSTQEVVATRERNPCATLQEIGTKYNVTRERVRQILNEAGVPTKSLSDKPVYLCLHCGEAIKGANKWFCDRKCAGEYAKVPLTCSECGIIFYRLKWQIINREKHKNSYTGKTQEHFFCTKSCSAKYIGREFGFSAYPENCTGSMYRHRKWDWDKVYELRDKTGWSATEIGKALGIPRPSVCYILSRNKVKA